ncbi:uncharacterized protein N0V89_000515 [Didymosphaeria variabile]|uniref:Uncharacterized protein n=1 Tax=Didymosphaeria variabile TaxID=1932322 RepID=A0A9W8XVC5_9PLEO|nr:uncharacterized protein N0V89_000515 [Didymosphaeria variabile]KAJ4359956.1 hypothetical protein N0V89_000515 [Didymosphaeria variabile]
MVASSSPFGLSKGALERRINNQIPRKRHTPYSVTKNYTRIPPKQVAHPKPKPTPVKSSAKIDISRVPQNRPERRGTDRTHITGTSSHGINQWSARRILASRTHPFNPSKTQYKVQWDTTWEDAREITGLAATEWKEAAHGGSTFRFRAQDGGEWTVLKDATSLENDSEESQWEMWRAIRRNAVKELEKDCFAALKDKEFVFASEAEELAVRQILKERWPEDDISARNVLRAARTQLSNDPELLETEISFGDVKIRFVVQLDPSMDTGDDKEGLHQEQRTAFTVVEIVRAMIPKLLDGLDDDAFSKGNAHQSWSRWCAVLKSLIRKAPFMFKSGTWLQLFAFLVLGSEDFRGELASVGIKVQDDWCQRAREYDMHMYYDQIVDDRSTHEIQETFLNLRDFFRDIGTDKELALESGLDGNSTTSGSMVCGDLKHESMAFNQQSSAPG